MPEVRENERVHYCDILVEQYNNATIWKNIWSVITMLIGVAVMYSLVILILSIDQTQLIESANKSFALLFEGAALTWITKQRKKAVDELDAIDKKFLEHCKKGSDRFGESPPRWLKRKQEIDERYGKILN